MPTMIKICIILWIVTLVYRWFLKAWIEANKFEYLKMKITNRLGESKALTIYSFLVIVDILFTAFCLINLIVHI